MQIELDERVERIRRIQMKGLEDLPFFLVAVFYASLIVLFNLKPEQAERIMSSAGTSGFASAFAANA